MKASWTVQVNPLTSINVPVHSAAGCCIEYECTCTLTTFRVLYSANAQKIFALLGTMNV